VTVREKQHPTGCRRPATPAVHNSRNEVKIRRISDA
jgi:hypothetical protein